jgi:hypothetical protein
VGDTQRRPHVRGLGPGHPGGRRPESRRSAGGVCLPRPVSARRTAVRRDRPRRAARRGGAVALSDRGRGEPRRRLTGIHSGAHRSRRLRPGRWPPPAARRRHAPGSVGERSGVPPP